jgi:hypothetical protein
MKFKQIVFVLAILLTNGCTTSPANQNAGKEVKLLDKLPSSELEVIAKDRAQERWKLLLAKDFDKAFDFYTTPSKVGIDSTFLAGYVNNLRVRNAVVKKAQCENNKCEVDFDLTIAMNVPRIQPISMDIPLKEVWIVEQNELRFIRPTQR